MRDKSRKQLLVTPAFAEARRRKLANDQTGGRVIPLPSSPHDCLYDNKSIKSAHAINSHSQGSRRSTVKSTRRTPTTFHHTNLWKIPARLLDREGIIIPRVTDKSEKSNSRNGLPLRIRTKGKSQGKLSETNERKPCRRTSEAGSQDIKDKIVSFPAMTEDGKDERKAAMITGKASKVFLPISHKGIEKWMKESNKTEKNGTLNFLNTLSPMGKFTKRNVRLPTRSDVTSESSASTCTDATERGRSFTKPTKNYLCVKYDSYVAPTPMISGKRTTAPRPDKRLYQTWHGLPAYPYKGNIVNISSTYMRPHRAIPQTFKIHPDWTNEGLLVKG